MYPILRKETEFYKALDLWVFRVNNDRESLQLQESRKETSLVHTNTRHTEVPLTHLTVAAKAAPFSNLMVRPALPRDLHLSINMATVATVCGLVGWDADVKTSISACPSPCRQGSLEVGDGT